MKPPAAKEAEILKACLEWLKMNDYEHWRSYTGPVVRGGGRERQWLTRNPNAGFPDLCGFLKNRPGVLWACEVKTSTGRLRPEQVEWIARLKRAGAVAFVARSPEQMAAVLRMEEGR